MRRLWFLSSLALAVSLGLAQSTGYKPDPQWIAPEKAKHRENPLNSKPEAAAGGEKIFQRMCVQCHGDATHAQAHNAPPLGLEVVQQETDGTLFWRISNGNSRKGMPSFNSVPEAQRWQLVLYIRSLGKK